MNGSLQTWLQQGEQLYQAAVDQFRDLESQLESLEAQLAAKHDEVNRLAQMLGKPAVEGKARGLTDLVPAQIMDDPPPRGSTGASSSNATIARALTGKFGR